MTKAHEKPLFVAVKIDDLAFQGAHSLVEDQLFESTGLEFEDFKHPFLLDNEINYKHRVLERARKILKPEDWPDPSSRPGFILKQIRKSCSPHVSSNLLEHRYRPPRFLHIDHPKVQLIGLEERLLDFFRSAKIGRKEFQEPFDALANFLRDNRLGCQWASVSYLAFLANNRLFFPVRASRFDKLLGYYGIDRRIGGRVSWEGYSLILDVADELKERLLIYGPPDAIEIQSYMWVAADLVDPNGPIGPLGDGEVDFDAEFKRRLKKVKSDEKIQWLGILGEKFVFNQQKRSLEKAGREDLALKVDLVSRRDDGCGFDILSFDPDGGEIHIEVKSTVRSADSDIGFTLTGNEWDTARRDNGWRLFRVWEVDSHPQFRDFGNIVLSEPPGWAIRPKDYRVERTSPE